MPRIDLDNLSDDRLEPYRFLKDTNQTRWAGLFIAEGEKLVRRLLASRFPLLSVLVTARQADRCLTWLPPAVPAYVLPDELVDTLVGFHFHRGVLACGQRLPSPSLEQVAGTAGKRLLIVLPDVTDPENLGAIIRIGAAFGIDALLLGPHCGDPFSRRVLRVSMGTSFSLPIVQSRDLAADLEQLRQQHQVQLAATVLSPTAEPLAQVRRPARLALLLGNEGHGLAEAWTSRCDFHWTIPMQGGTDSLNVAVAAGIFLHHLTNPGQT